MQEGHTPDGEAIEFTVTGGERAADPPKAPVTPEQLEEFRILAENAIQQMVQRATSILTKNSLEGYENIQDDIIAWETMLTELQTSNISGDLTQRFQIALTNITQRVDQHKPTD